MSSFQVERLPDAIRTMRRLAVCFVGAFIFIFARWQARLNGYDSSHFSELIRFENSLTAGVALVISALAISVFTWWQTEARNVLCDESGLGWLSIHGWEGEEDKLPQRGLVPISEVIGISIFTLTCALPAPVAIVLLPMTWSSIRLLNCWKTSIRQHPYAFGAVCLLHSTAILCCRTLSLALPIELFAIVLSEYLMFNSLRRKAEELLTSDITIMRNQSDFASSNSSPRRRHAAMDQLGLRLFPFYQLRPAVEFSRPSWMKSIWIAIVAGWVMYCMATRIADFGTITNKAGAEISIYAMYGMMGMIAIGFIGLVRTLIQFESFVWTPRIGLISRIQLLRPIVWSWDRMLLPHVLNIAICSLALAFRMPATPVEFAIYVAAEVLILLRVGVTPEEWQMTCDARLSSTQLSSGRRNHTA